MRRLLPGYLAFVFVVALAPGAHGTTANDLCAPSANPCLLSTDVTVSSGSVLDFGTRAFQVRPTGRLRIAGGTLTIIAASVRVEPTGLISGMVGPGLGGTIEIQATGDVRVEATGSGTGRIDVTANQFPGAITIDAGGNVVISGQLKADGTGSAGNGGQIFIDAGGTVDASGSLSARGGVPGLGGHARLSGTAVTVGGSINVAGGDGGDIDLESRDTDLVVNNGAAFDVSAGGTFGDGGSVDLLGKRHVTMNGAIAGGGAGSDTEGGGLGADLVITSQTGNVGVNGTQDLHGAAPDGEGGDVDIVAALDAVSGSSGRFFVQTGGLDACGGFFSVSAGRLASLGGSVDVGGGFCGGDIDAVSSQQITVTTDLNSDANGAGGNITLEAPRIVTSGRLRASGTGTFASGGFIGLTACDITQAAGSSSSSTANGAGGMNTWQASGVMQIGGTLRAGEENRLEYRTTPPVIQGTATIIPTQVVVQNSALPPCTTAVCGNGTREIGEECDDSNTVPCDGCNAACIAEECGNGELDCNEECDAGPANGGPGSQCDATCHVRQGSGLLFVTGGRRRTGCVLEWAIVNPNGAVSNGFPENTQSCVDGDPTCDADGVDNGSCDFTLSACLNVTDERIPDCNPVATDSVNLRRPSPLRPADATDQANATALVDALRTLGPTILSEDQVLYAGSPDAQRDHCTQPLRLKVPHNPGLVGRRLLHATGKPTGIRSRRNRLTLACEANPSVCGNGTLEVTEACDDGNTVACDGCSERCQVEACGDGIVACGEQCDEGVANGTPGGTCTDDCTEAPPALRIPAGTASTDCVHSWSIATATPILLRSGLPSSLQTCVDNDPSCDFDPTPGTCRLHVWECVGGADDRIGCAADTITGASVLRPSVKATGLALAQREALVAGLGYLQFPTGPGEACGGRADIDIPASRRRLVLRAGATTIGGRTDRDTFRLGCLVGQ